VCIIQVVQIISGVIYQNVHFYSSNVDYSRPNTMTCIGDSEMGSAMCSLTCQTIYEHSYIFVLVCRNWKN